MYRKQNLFFDVRENIFLFPTSKICFLLICFHEQFTRSVLSNKSQGLVPKIQTGLNSWDCLQGPKLVPATRF